MHDIIGVLGGTLDSRLWAAGPNTLPTQGDLGAYRDLRSPFPPHPPPRAVSGPHPVPEPPAQPAQPTTRSAQEEVWLPRPGIWWGLSAP